VTATVRCAVAVAALALALPAAAAHAVPGPKAPLSQHGNWITDARGRTVILHGVNMVYKRSPYAPSAAGFNGPDATFLERHGFDTVRLGLIYAGVEPHPGHYDSAYLAKIAKTQRVLARHRIFSLLDFHQDLYNEKFTGEGFPKWAVLDQGQPTEPLTGFPGTYFSSPGENASWDSLWSDAAGPGGIGLQERYAAAWKRVAKDFRSRSYLMGYDPINEPWPGNGFQQCLMVSGCPAFEHGPLADLEGKVVAAIRKVDPRHTVWYEPVVTANSGTTYNTTKPKGGNVAFNFHDYCLAGTSDPPCGALEQKTVDNAKAYIAAKHEPALLSEFGATDDIPTIERMVTRADDAMLSWQWWHYCGCNDPTTSGPGDTQALVHNPKKPPSGSNVFKDKLAALERPYPQAVAGTPKAYAYDPGTDIFTLRYSTKAPDGKRLRPGIATIVYVPDSHYRHGYTAKVTGAKVLSRPRARYLILKRSSGARSVSLKLTPRGAQ
jgi:endoglycosylceramidase